MTAAFDRRPEIGFASYDRFFPNQDTLPAGGFGNLIALPLQGSPRKAGNTVFVDDDLVRDPRITARYLADYMSASERSKRTIVRNCKFPPTARVIQHNEAKAAVAGFFLGGLSDIEPLQRSSQSLRDRLADTDFQRDLYDHNADYIDRFIETSPNIELPTGSDVSMGDTTSVTINGVRVSTEISFRLQRVTRTNKTRVGGAMLRYSKGNALNVETANWQSAFLFGQMTAEAATGIEPEHQLCLTIDVYAGIAYPAPEIPSGDIETWKLHALLSPSAGTTSLHHVRADR